MSTAAEALVAIAAKAVTLTGGTRMSSDYTDLAQQLTRGASRFQLQSTVSLDVRDSNNTYTVLLVTLIVQYRIDTAEAELVYTQGDRLTWQLAVADPAWWSDMAEIFGLLDDAEIEFSETARDGDIIEWEVETSLRVQP